MGVICTSSSSKEKENESKANSKVKEINRKPIEKESTKPYKAELKTTDTDNKKTVHVTH